MLYVYLREKATVWRMMLGVTRDAAANHRATPMGRTRYKCESKQFYERWYVSKPSPGGTQ